ncbi:MAG: hypothetical protein RIS35_2928 [Pseudomonadota bacterium]
MFAKKSLLALAIGAGFALPAAAQSKIGDWEFYGRAHFSLDQLDDGAKYSEFNASSNSSRFGFRGSKSFGSVTGLWQIEQEVFFNLNDTEANKNRIATRDTFAGLRGTWGQFRFGKFDTPFKAAREPANLFGDMAGDMRNLTSVGNARFDERLNNMIEYQTPNFNGFQAKIAYALHEGSQAAVDASTGAGKDEQALSLALHYKAGIVDAAAAWEDYGKDAARGERDAVRLAVGITPVKNLKLVAFYQDANHATDGGKVTGFGAEYALTQKTYLRGHVFTRSADKANADATLYAIGVEHRIDRQLRVYANYGQVSNDPASNLNPWTQGRSTAQPGTNGENATAVSFGVRYDF